MQREIKHHHDGQGLTELCHVYAVDPPHPVNGAHHEYRIDRELSQEDLREGCGVSVCAGWIQFQRGPRTASDSTPGTLDGALLSVLIDRFESFQSGPFACPENGETLGHLRAALDCMIARARERASRGVLGKNAK